MKAGECGLSGDNGKEWLGEMEVFKCREICFLYKGRVL